MSLYVYAIAESSEGPTKVGISSDCRKRLFSLQTGNPRPLKLGLTFPCDNAEIIEEQVHARLAPYAMTGEWFSVSLVVAERTITQVIAGIEDEIIDTDQEVLARALHLESYGSNIWDTPRMSEAAKTTFRQMALLAINLLAERKSKETTDG